MILPACLDMPFPQGDHGIYTCSTISVWMMTIIFLFDRPSGHEASIALVNIALVVYRDTSATSQNSKPGNRRSIPNSATQHMDTLAKDAAGGTRSWLISHQTSLVKLHEEAYYQRTR